MIQGSLNADFVVVTDSSSSDEIHPTVQTVADDKVDVVADLFVATHQRHQFVDFSYPIKVFQNV